MVDTIVSNPVRTRRVRRRQRMTVGRVLRAPFRLASSKLVLRLIIAFIVAFGAWNTLHFDLATATRGPMQTTLQDVQNGMMDKQDIGTLLTFGLLWLLYGVALLYTVNKAWKGFGPVARVLTCAIMLMSVGLVYVKFGDSALMQSTAAIVTLVQFAFFIVLWFGLSRAEVDRYLSGTATTSNLNEGQHADDIFIEEPVPPHH